MTDLSRGVGGAMISDAADYGSIASIAALSSAGK
jgi:hypothetical protein